MLRIEKKQLDSRQPIGLFDSGMGGLTVLREVSALLPREHLIYLGDTARLPYGNKSPDAIRSFSLDNASFLLEQKVKLIVVSCHTACSHAFSLLQSKLPIPVIGVTEAGISSLQAATQTGRVAVLGTASTIASNTYQNALARFTVFPVACPLFVPLVEEGLHNSEAAFLIAEHYLGFLRTKNLDAALLACTHYPLLRTPIQAALGDAVRLIEPAKACAEQVRSTLASHGLLNTAPALPQYRFYASDDPEKFRRLASLFFPSPIESVELRRFS